MNLKGAEASRYIARPDPGRAGLLLAGADTMRVAIRRAEAVLALIGPEGEAEMRLTRIAASDLRKSAALLGDALRESGFFPGPRVVLLEEATDGLTGAVEAALADWRAGDASLVVTAGALTGKSTLKSLFDKRADCVSVIFYDEPPSREEIEAELRKAGLARIEDGAMHEIVALSRALEPGDFRQTLDKISLYKHGDPSALTAAEVASLAPATTEAEVEALILAVADGRVADLGPLLQRIAAQGTSPVTICIGALGHFKALHAAASDPAGPAAALKWARGGFRQREAMQRQAGQWGSRALERALSHLVETDLTLRSTSKAPTMAVMERALLRLATMKR
ncbi:MAG: DNA polymerase III subunit delta [Paracoccaceae bacterium]